MFRRVFAVLATVLVLIPAAHAASFVVDRTDDADVSTCLASANDCTLRGAINAANAMTGADTITFDGSLAGQTISVATVAPASIADTPANTLDNQVTAFGPTALLITSDIIINGLSGNSGVTIARNSSVANLRLFGIAGVGSLTLRRLTLQGGTAQGGNGDSGGGGAAGLGGAIFNNGGTLSLESCTLTGHSAKGGNGVATAGGGGGGGLASNASGLNGGGPNGGTAGASGGFGGGGSTSNASGASGGFGGGGASGGFGGFGGFGGGGGGGFFAGGGGFGGGSGGGGMSGNSGGGGAGLGGAIFNNGGTLSARNSTFFSNSAQAGSSSSSNGASAYGGAVFSRNGTLTLDSCTLASNTVAGLGNGQNQGGALYLLGDGGGATVTYTVKNSILADSTGSSDAFVNVINGGTTTNNGSGFNLVEANGSNTAGADANDLPGVTQSADPKLAALQPKGGPTQTMALLAGSPALDAGNSMLTTDQRGFTRPVDLSNVGNAGGNGSDIGAYEVQRPRDADFTKAFNEDSTLSFAAADFTGAFSDPENGAPLQQIQIVTLPPNGTLLLNGVAITAGQAIADTDLGKLSFVPNANFNGTATFLYNGANASGYAPDATITLQVLAVNDAPSFTVGATQTVNENSGPQVLAGFITNISPGPADENGQTLAFTVTNDNNALFAVQPSIASDGTLSYTPAANAAGIATVSVTLQDNGGTANGGVDSSAAQTFIITVNAVNHAPVALDQQLSADNATPLSITLSATDVDNDALVFAVTAGPQHGTLSGTAPNLIYTATPGFRGSDAFTFTVSDGQATATASVTISVGGAPAVTANNDSYTLILGPPNQTQQSGVVLLSSGVFQIQAPGVLRNDSFTAGSVLTVRAISNPQHGRFQLRNDGTLYYLPSTGFIGLDEFSYAFTDGKTTATARVRVNVIDKRVPELAFDTPRDRATVASLTKIAGRVRDRNAGLKAVTLLWQRFDGKFWNGRAWTAAATELPLIVQGINWVYNGPLPKIGSNAATDLLDGRYDLRVSALDKSNNLAQITNRLTVSTPPVVSTVRLSSASASAVQDTIVLNFTGALNAEAARNVANYRVLLGDGSVKIADAAYGENTVTLSGLELSAGDKIELQLSGLKDAEGKTIRGGTLNLIAR